MDDTVSRSEKKRQFKQVESVARELAGLSLAERRRLPASEQFKEELQALDGTRAGARKRQLKYLAKLLRQEPYQEILRFLSEEKGSRIEARHDFREAERWRDAIVNEALQAAEQAGRHGSYQEPDFPSSSVAEVVDRYPGLDEGDLRRAAYQYARSRNRLYYRELFRMIKAELEKTRRDRDRVGEPD